MKLLYSLLFLLFLSGSAFGSDIDLDNRTIDYPLGVVTDADKLEFAYRAQEKLREDHNTKAVEVRAGRMDLRDWLEYQERTFLPISKVVSGETARLNDGLGYNTLDPNDPVDQAAINAQSDRKIQYKNSVRYDPDLGDLDSPRISTSIGPRSPPLAMPVSDEDLTTYTEIDTDSVITVTASKIDVVGQDRDVDGYVYADLGTVFTGDFNHQISAYRDTGSNNSSYVAVWMVSNYVGDLSDHNANDENALAVYQFRNAVPLYFTYTLWEIDGASNYFDATNEGDIAENTEYCIQPTRDESIGTYGTLYVYVRDSTCTTLIDTLSITLHTSKKDFSNAYGFASYNNGNPGLDWIGYTQNLDLNLGGGGGGGITLIPQIIIKDWDWTPERWAWMRTKECVAC